MTESGGSSGNRPADQPPSSGAPGGELPQWQPFADAPPASAMAPADTPPPPAIPSAMPDESALTPSPGHDAGTIVPDQLHDAPMYVPQPMGMGAGGVMPPADPADVPTSAWITTAPQTAPKAGMRSTIGTIVVAVVGLLVVGVVAAGILGFLPSDKGKILFGTAAGTDLCSVGNQATMVKSTDPIFFAAVLKHHMDGAQAITFKIEKDGKELVNHPEPADGTSFDCYGSRDSIGSLEPGSYVFTVVHNADVEATGNLTVSQ